MRTFLGKVVTNQQRAMTFKNYMKVLCDSYNQGDMFYAGFILPWALEAPTQESSKFLDLFH